jgi:predicted TPR repeat methyltransferase
MGAELTEDDIEIAKSKLALLEGEEIKDEETDTFVDDLLDQVDKQPETEDI